MSRRSGRRERRYLNKQNKKQHLKQYDNINQVASLNHLYVSARKSSKGVKWKASTQRYLLGILFNIVKTKRDIVNNKDIRQGFNHFTLNERGKIRKISSVHFRERVVQKAVCTYVLYPTLTNGLITDNSASQKEKGTSFATKRLHKHLAWFIRRYGRSGYALCIDYKSYFENISHKIVKDNYRKYITDTKLLRLLDDFVNAFGDKGLGLGSETSQINAIAHVNKIDHYIKEQNKIHCYGRYMDDSYIIHQSKTFLQQLLNKLKYLLKEYGVIINNKKTHIIPLSKCFHFLKTRYFITKDLKIIKKPTRKSIRNQRRKLKRQFKLVQNNVLSLEDVRISFNSWKSSMLYRNARCVVYNMTNLFKNLVDINQSLYYNTI